MDFVSAVRRYIDKMVQEVGEGMKVILMDKETVSIMYTITYPIVL